MTPAPEDVVVPARPVLDPELPAGVTAELATMSSAAGLLGMLDDAARWRVVSWLVDFFRVPLDQPYDTPEDHATIEQVERAVVAEAARWAASVVAEMNPAELEQTVLNGMGWGDAGGLVAGVLPEIAERLRKMAEAAIAEGEAPWQST